MLTVCTGWNAKGWIQYGQRFAETFDRFWDPDVRLLVYGEEPRELLGGLPGSGRKWAFFPLTKIPDLVRFLAQHDDPVYCGRDRVPSQQVWKPRAIAAGYNWRYDAAKFSRQGFIPLDALLQCVAGDHLVWLDGDVVTHRHVGAREIEALLPADKHIAYLGRGAKHPEIGFQLYRAGPVALAFLQEFARIYTSGDLFRLREWHSAFAWHEALKRIGTHYAHDLTPGGSGHVWHESALRQWTDHLKGDRKKSGRSPERRL